MATRVYSAPLELDYSAETGPHFYAVPVELDYRPVAGVNIFSAPMEIDYTAATSVRVYSFFVEIDYDPTPIPTRGNGTSNAAPAPGMTGTLGHLRTHLGSVVGALRKGKGRKGC